MRFSSKGFELVSPLVGSPRLSQEEDEEGRDYWLETVSICGCFDTSQQSKASSEGHHMSVCASCYQWPQAQACPRTSPHFAPLRKTLGGRSTPGCLGSWHFLSISSLCWAQKYMIGQNDLVRLFFVINDHTDILLDMLQNETIYLTWREDPGMTMFFFFVHKQVMVVLVWWVRWTTTLPTLHLNLWNPLPIHFRSISVPP